MAISRCAQEFQVQHRFAPAADPDPPWPFSSKEEMTAYDSFRSLADLVGQEPSEADRRARIDNALKGVETAFEEQQITWEQRKELYRVLMLRRPLDAEFAAMLASHPFSLACLLCDCDSPDSYQEAIAAGWEEIEFDDGVGWWFLGVCPDCIPQWIT